jgi:hypothetical protein
VNRRIPKRTAATALAEAATAAGLLALAYVALLLT